MAVVESCGHALVAPAVVERFEKESMYGLFRMVGQSTQTCYFEGDIKGYPIPQYRKKNWQIPKYRVNNRRNTDAAFMIGHVYLKLYPFRSFVYL